MKIQITLHDLYEICKFGIVKFRISSIAFVVCKRKVRAYFSKRPSVGIDQRFPAQHHRLEDIVFGNAPSGIQIPAAPHILLGVFRAGTTESNSLPRT